MSDSFDIITSRGEGMKYSRALRLREEVVSFGREGLPWRVIAVATEMDPISFISVVKSKVYLIPPWVDKDPNDLKTFKTPRSYDDPNDLDPARIIDGKFFYNLNSLALYAPRWKLYNSTNKEYRIPGRRVPLYLLTISSLQHPMRSIFMDRGSCKVKWVDWPWNGWAWEKEFKGDQPC